MMPENKLRELLQRSASDPGPKEQWDTFIHTARRRRRVHRALLTGGALLLVGLFALAAVVVRGGIERHEPPDPANTNRDERQEDGDREVDETLDDLERRIRRQNEIVQEVELVAGPQQPPATREEAPLEPGRDEPENKERGTEPVVDDGKETIEVSPARASCRGDRATIIGTPGPDRLRGTSGRDVIAGLGGRDTISGGSASDYICGGAGIDRLFGEAGQDSLVGDGGQDLLSGGPGHDFAHFPGATQGVTVDLLRKIASGQGTDTLEGIEAGDGTQFDDTLIGDDGPNFFAGDSGADSIQANGGDDALFPGGGDDLVDGGAGRDVAGFTTAGSPNRPGVQVDLASNRAIGEGNDRLIAIESANGSFGDDVFSGNGASNGFYGSFGDDRMSGAGGDDFLLGGPDDDSLDGGPGDDFLDGSQGVDTCTNGERLQGCEAGGVGAAGFLSVLAWGGWRLRKRRRPDARRAPLARRTPSGDGAQDRRR